MNNKYSETLYANTRSYFDAILHDIEHAEKTIDVEVYIYNKDPLGREVAAALSKAAEQGKQVRLLVDGAGTPLWGGGKFTKDLEKTGVLTKVFHPFPWGFWQWSRSVVNLPSLLKAVYLLLQINTRNHRKTFLIDNKIAYIGSVNIDQRHLEKESGGKDWRDFGVRIENGQIDHLVTAFESAWNGMSTPERLQKIFEKVDTNAQIRLNHTRHQRRMLYKNLLKRIARCKTRIWITNAYFVPDTFLLKKIKEVAHTGVDVRILLPKKSDVSMMPLASMIFYRSLLKAGVRIFEYLPSMLHAKALILDDWMMVGTSNLNHRSLLHDLEADVNIRDPANIQALEQQFFNDLNDSDEIKLKHWQQRPWYQHLISRAILFAKYWI